MLSPPKVVDPEIHGEWLCGLMGLFMHPLETAPCLLAWDNSSGVPLPHTANTDYHCKFLHSPAPVEVAVI